MDKMPPVGDTCIVETTLAAVNFDYWSLAPTTSCSFPCSIFSLSLTSVLLLLLLLLNSLSRYLHLCLFLVSISVSVSHLQYSFLVGIPLL